MCKMSVTHSVASQCVAAGCRSILYLKENKKQQIELCLITNKGSNTRKYINDYSCVFLLGYCQFIS